MDHVSTKQGMPDQGTLYIKNLTFGDFFRLHDTLFGGFLWKSMAYRQNNHQKVN